MTEPGGAPPPPAPFVLRKEDVPDRDAAALLDGALVAEPPVATVELTGPGAVACLQGLLTNDVEKPGEGSFVYGALLTPKGMIVCDLWAARERGTVRLTVPRHGLGSLTAIFQRSLPPRLARAVDRTGDIVTLHLAGPRALELAARAGLAIPTEGRETAAIVGERACFIARPHGGAPFALQITVPAAHGSGVRSDLVTAGCSAGSPTALELARVLAGWPRLGAEIDDKTLPQEARFDEIGGVSYTKGCYTGQETVARLHFRGHANRSLLGLSWQATPDFGVTDVLQGSSRRGRVTSIAWLGPLEQYVGLAMLRRETELDAPVIAAGAEAVVLPLPLAVEPHGG
jgi:folate-binding protein YgfZ